MKEIITIEKSDSQDALSVAISPNSKYLLVGHSTDLKIYDFQNNFTLLKEFKKYHKGIFIY